MDETFDYCREIESYLCKKNEGHLIRIVGPAFEMVRGWADQGIPLKIALRGIDRTCERLATKAQRRRPLRIEFCEADVLDAFDDWRRAIGTGVDRVSESPPPPRKSSLAEHIARAVSRLVAVRLNGNSERLGQTIAHAIAVLDELAGSARQSRGEARAQIIARLADLDAELMSAARATVDATTADALRSEVEADLAPFAAKMADDVRARAAAAAYERLLRESVSLPVLTYE